MNKVKEEVKHTDLILCEEIDKLKAINKELLEACKQARLIFGMVPTDDKAYSPITMSMLDKAIQKAEATQ